MTPSIDVSRIKRLRWLAGSAVLLAGAALGQSVEGSYKRSDPAPGTQVQVEIKDCKAGQCRFDYTFSGQRFCTYQGTFNLPGDTATYHLEARGDEGEPLSCDLEFRFIRRGLDQLLELREAEDSLCTVIADCRDQDILGGTYAIPRSRPSFDCERAGAGVEKIICNNIELGQLDLELAARFARLRKRIELRLLVASQKQWLKSRQHCLNPREQREECLLGEYRERVDLFGNLEHYLRLRDTLDPGQLPTRWQATGAALVAAGTQELGNPMFERWARRAVGNEVGKEFTSKDLGCDALEKSVTDTRLVVFKDTCQEPGPFLLELTGAGEFWLIHDDYGDVVFSNFQNAELSAAPAPIKDWLEQRVGKQPETDVKVWTVLPAWPEPAVFNSGCFWSDKTFAEWVGYWSSQDQQTLAQDAQRRLQACGQPAP